MGRTARRPGPPSVLIGVWGKGETSPENIEALLSEYIEGLGEVTPRFLIPLDKEITTETIADVANWALDNKHDVEVVEAVASRTKMLKDIKADADKVHEADDDDGENPIKKVFSEALIAKGDDARLLFLWHEEDGEPDEDDQRVLAGIYDGGVVCLDLTQGLDVLNFDPDDDDADKGGDDTSKSDDKGGGADDGPTEDEVRGYAIRRLRKHALEVAEDRRKAKEKGVPKDDALEEMGKTDLLEFLFGPDDAGGGDGGKDEPEDADKGITPRRARQMREESEKEGTDSSTRNRRRGAAAAASKDEETPAEPSEGEDSGATASEALSSLREGIDTLMDDKATDDEVADAIEQVAEAFADYLIDRIAARVEKEPEGSAVRKEVAPPRPPGRARKDGATPTRRRQRA